MITERKAGSMNIYVIFLAIGINATRIVGFIIEELTDLRPYVYLSVSVDIQHHAAAVQYPCSLPVLLLGGKGN